MSENLYNYDESRLSIYLRYDFLTGIEGTALLGGSAIPYRGTSLVEGVENYDFSHGEYVAQKTADIITCWERSNHDFKRKDFVFINFNPLESKFPPAYFIEWALSKNFRPDWLDYAIEKGFYKPKATTPPAVIVQSPVTYSNKWLAIQQAAIAQFFNPRRNPDAKSEEVIKWIIKQAKTAGIKEPATIAAAIFTIIKPEDHNVKTKRVPPL